jgi:hypothetical protein
MVFYFLTPAGIRRYSSSNLCPALSSRVGARAPRKHGGIQVVNRAGDLLILVPGWSAPENACRCYRVQSAFAGNSARDARQGVDVAKN